MASIGLNRSLRVRTRKVDWAPMVSKASRPTVVEAPEQSGATVQEIKYLGGMATGAASPYTQAPYEPLAART